MLIATLGRQPEISIAELESILGADSLTILHSAALIEKEVADVPFFRLGGVIKLGKVLNILETTDWTAIEKYLIKVCPEHSALAPEGKLTLGISTYGFKLSPKMLERTGLSIKKAIKSTGRPVRLVPNKDLEISTPQVIHNKLTHENGWDLLLYRDGSRTILARTVFVQDIEGYTARDQARPFRDAHVGMLPPKLAQIIINLASSNIKNSTEHDLRLLDPFCGTGVILQEAALMGFSVYGTDIEPRMIDYSTKNLEWLKTRFNVDFEPKLETGDATKHRWTPPIDCIATETTLGAPMSGQINPKQISDEIHKTQQILKLALKNIASQLKPGTPCCFAIPAWYYQNKIHSLPLIDQLTEMGYTLASFVNVSADSLIYRREDQTVGRQLLVVTRK